MRTACRGMFATVCCLPWEKNRSSRQGRDAKNAEDRPPTKIRKRAGLKPGLYTNEYIMALENCTLCRGTGWRLVPRGDGAAGKVAGGRGFGGGERGALFGGEATKPAHVQEFRFLELRHP